MAVDWEPQIQRLLEDAEHMDRIAETKEQEAAKNVQAAISFRASAADYREKAAVLEGMTKVR